MLATGVEDVMGVPEGEGAPVRGGTPHWGVSATGRAIARNPGGFPAVVEVQPAPFCYLAYTRAPWWSGIIVVN